jgi:hypothetical protein
MKRKKVITASNETASIKITIELTTKRPQFEYQRIAQSEVNRMFTVLVSEVMRALGYNKTPYIDTNLSLLKVSK